MNFLDRAIEAHIQAIALVDRELAVCIPCSKRIHSAQLNYDGNGVMCDKCPKYHWLWGRLEFCCQPLCEQQQVVCFTQSRHNSIRTRFM